MNVPFYSEIVRSAADAVSCVRHPLAQMFSAGRLWIIRLTPVWSTWVYSPLPGIAWVLVSMRRELGPKLCAIKNRRSDFTRGGRSH